jgi:hypothetical protein
VTGSPESAERGSPDRASPAPVDPSSDEPATASSQSATSGREGAHDEVDGDEVEGDEVEVDEVDEADGGDEHDAELAGESGPDPLRFNRWMKRSTTGAVLTGVTIGLQQALEKRDQRPAFVIEAPGEPEDDEPLVRLQFDPDSPSNTVVVVRADAGHERAPSPHVEEPNNTEPDR